MRIQLHVVLLLIHRARVQHSQCFHDGVGKSSEVTDIEAPARSSQIPSGPDCAR
jgi:hypothetical protein